MKNRFTGIALLMLLSFSSASQAEYKIGVVNAIKVVEAAPQAELARKAIEEEFAPRDRELVGFQKELKKSEDRLSKDGAVMSKAARRKLERDILSRKRELKRMQDEFREDLNFRRNEELSKLQRDVFAAIQSLAKSEKYDLIVGEGVIFTSDRIDITNKVLEQLRKDVAARKKKK